MTLLSIHCLLHRRILYVILNAQSLLFLNVEKNGDAQNGQAEYTEGMSVIEQMSSVTVTPVRQSQGQDQ